MEIQRLVSLVKSLPGVVRPLTSLQKVAVTCAFLGSLSLGYGFYLHLHPVSARLPDEDVVQLNQELPEEGEESASSAPVVPSLAIDVSGAVVHPGVYLLVKGERVSDAVTKAGGFAKKADKAYINKSINLAQTAQDAMKIYIPFEGEEVVEKGSTASSITGAQVAASTQSTVNVNTATVAQLDELKGIGAARAQQIVDNRPYTDLSDFSTKSGLSQSLVDQLSGLISF